jgi:hypothetical protein
MTSHILIGTVCHCFMDSYPGIDPFGFYCSVTGKRIGRNAEVEDFLTAQPVDSDPEALADDLALRIFASMRPSILWNRMRMETLDELRVSRPVEVLAYLLNRAFTPIKGGNAISIAHDKIRTFHACSDLRGFDREAFDSVMFLLLEIDAKQGLNTVYPTFRVDDLIAATGADGCESFMQMLRAWHHNLMREHEKFQKRMEMETRWWRSGNALAKPAFFSAFMAAKPLSENQQRVATRKAESDMFADILNEVMGKPKLDGTETIAKPVAKRVVLPSTKMPALFARKA